MLIRHIHHHSKKDKLILMLKQHYCSISDDQQLHNKSKPVSNLLYDNACKYYQINHKWQISKHEIRFPLHFTKILNPYKSLQNTAHKSVIPERKNLCQPPWGKAPYTLIWNFYWPLQPYNDDRNQTNTLITAELPKDIIHHHSQK